MEGSAPVATPAAASTPAPVTINSGDSALTFDDLDSIEASHKAAKKAAKSEVKETVKETVKALDKGGLEKDGAKDEPDEKNANEKETEDKARGKEKKEADLAKAREEKLKKLIKAKAGDKELDLDPDMMIPFKVDGKDDFITLKDLLSQQSGKVSYDKKFSQLDQERRQFYDQHDQINSRIKNIMEEQDPELRFFHMAELAGKDPVQTRQQFLDDNIKFLEKWYSMSDHERVAEMKDYENKVLKYRLDSKMKEDTHRQTVTALEGKIQELGKNHQIEQGEFWNKYDELKSIKQNGKLNLQITPEIVAEAIVKERLWTAAADVINHSEHLPNERKTTVLSELVDKGHSLGLSPAAIKEVADEMFGSKLKQKAVEQKVIQKEEIRTGRKPEKDKPAYKHSDESALFDDIL